jgi:hypothetical protein
VGDNLAIDEWCHFYAPLQVGSASEILLFGDLIGFFNDQDELIGPLGRPTGARPLKSLVSWQIRAI